MEQIKLLIGRIDALSLRERAIILAGIVFVMYMLWDSLLMSPQMLEQRKILADLQLKRAEQSALNIKFQNLLKKGALDTDGDKRRKLEELKQQLVQIDSEVKNSTTHLVPADKMTMVLQTILNRTSGLELIEIKGLGVSPLIPVVKLEGSTTSVSAAQNAGEQANAANEGLNNAYKHGLIIRLEGDYMSTLAYMRELESLEWGFFWESLEYEVIEYPIGRVAITLYTLSLDKDWIGA